MRYHRIDRPAGAIQQSVSGDTVQSLCRRAFGVEPVAASELPWGSYNNAYQIEFITGPPVVLRMAPEPARQFRVESAMMRNEYAATPYLAPLGELLPRTLFADFTQQLIGRDYVFQTLLPGVPAPEGMARYPRPQWTNMFRQFGVVARRLHDVAGPAFGPVAGPWRKTWSEHIVWYFRTAAGDVHEAGHDARNVWRLAEAAERFSAVLDEVAEPRLLHGDGWTANFLVDPESADLTLTGVCDWDRAEWGDPLADWAIQRAMLRPGSERDTFWEGYGQPRPSADGVRQRFYRARHVVGLLLDHLRAGHADQIAATYEELGDISDGLATGPYGQ